MKEPFKAAHRLAAQFCRDVENALLDGRFPADKVIGVMTESEKSALTGLGQQRWQKDGQGELKQADLYAQVLRRTEYDDAAARLLPPAFREWDSILLLEVMEKFNLLRLSRCPAPALKKTQLIAETLGLLESRTNRGGYRHGHSND